MDGNILLNIGDLPDQPGIQGYIEVINGANFVAKAKEEVASKTGLDSKFYNIYTFINCFSEAGAELVKARLSEARSKLLAECNVEAFFGAFFDAYLGPKSVLDITVHGTTVIINASPSKKILNMLSNDNDEEELEYRDQKTHIEFSIGHEIGTILESENKIIYALDALRLSISHNQVSLFSEELLNSIFYILFGWDREGFGFAKIPLSILQSGDLQLNFKSARELPEYLKEKAKIFVENEEFLYNVKFVCPYILRCLGELAEHTTGEVDGFWSTDKKFQKFKLHAPGLFRALASD